MLDACNKVELEIFVFTLKPQSHKLLLLITSFWVFPSRLRASSQSTTRTTNAKRMTTQTSSRRPAPSFESCLGCQRKRSWSTITPAATGRARCRDKDGSTSASTTSASTPTYWEKKVGYRLICHTAIYYLDKTITVPQ